MPNPFNDHHRIVQTAERNDFFIHESDDAETAVINLQEDLREGLNQLLNDLTFIATFLDKHYPTDDLDDDDIDFHDDEEDDDHRAKLISLVRSPVGI